MKEVLGVVRVIFFAVAGNSCLAKMYEVLAKQYLKSRLCKCCISCHFRNFGITGKLRHVYIFNSVLNL